MFTKQEIIAGMCLTLRHDYGTLPEGEQVFIRKEMEQLYEHNIIPLLKDLYDDARCACPHCMATVAKNIKRAMVDTA